MIGAAGFCAALPRQLSAQNAATFRSGPYRTLDELSASLTATGISTDEVQTLLALAKPSIALQSTAVEDSEIAVGAGKIGGSPDVPRDFIWPLRQPTVFGLATIETLRKYEADNSDEDLKRQIALKEALAKRVAPLAFMTQIDLAVCAAAGRLDEDIPRAGRLLLFYDLVFNPQTGQEPNGNRLFQLIHVETDQLTRKTAPDLGYPLFGGIDVYRNCLPSARFRPVFTYTLPDQRAAPITPSYLNRPYPHENWSDLQPTHLEASNRLGGWPENIKKEMTIDLAAADAGVDITQMNYRDVFKRLERSAQQWVLLLQIGAYDNDINDFNGLYYIWIKREDLRARDFSKARLIYQKDE
ncbi:MULTISPECIES: DUF1963 domain-containing protein [unclassified Beijerinckia]|uniref:DUF1963 domain-containing protein n=1 Tax=unclassified Beijerinckia TaxID=2638183 RepID=UPI000B828CEA|nr:MULTISPECIES: DUF1963 domain-containing protein [unclassified Beijerinckia]